MIESFHYYSFPSFPITWYSNSLTTDSWILYENQRSWLWEKYYDSIQDLLPIQSLFSVLQASITCTSKIFFFLKKYQVFYFSGCVEYTQGGRTNLWPFHNDPLGSIPVYWTFASPVDCVKCKEEWITYNLQTVFKIYKSLPNFATWRNANYWFSPSYRTNYVIREIANIRLLRFTVINHQNSINRNSHRS